MPKEQVASVIRAMSILKCFTNHDKEWTLRALIEELDMPSTTIYRQLTTLTEREYLVQDPVRKSYKIGPRLLAFAAAVLSQSDIRKVARPILEDLSNTVQETINLGTLLDYDFFYLDKVETHRSIVCNTQLGSRAPAYATAAGKVMLSNKDADYIQKYCEWMDENAYTLTENTIIDTKRLREELELTKKRGYAMDNGEIEEGLICIAAPILDMNKKVVAAVSISGPDYRMQEDQEMMIREVCSAAKRISVLLGCLK
jgi:DNA-binding IclR family transcriptional regulator